MIHCVNVERKSFTVCSETDKGNGQLGNDKCSSYMRKKPDSYRLVAYSSVCGGYVQVLMGNRTEAAAVGRSGRKSFARQTNG